jgi:hypothetical protein
MNTLSQSLFNQARRQLTFLRNSAVAYDGGDSEEALRIAVAIRVLLHDTNYSISLLKRLGKKDSLKLISTAKDIPREQLVGIDFGELMAGMAIGNSMEYSPVPDGMPAIRCCDWWIQPVFIRDNIIYSRKDVILSAANKDGGAHVDEPDGKLKALQQGFWEKTQINVDGSKVITSLDNNHFRMLRRFADELLLSSELLTLAA